MLRTLAERYFRNRKLKRTLPSGVTLYVSPDSQLKYLRHKFDLDLAEMAERYIGNSSVVWDVGTNCGTMAFNAAKAEQIVAVEADPFLVSVLQDSVALSGIPIHIVAGAAFSDVSLAEFVIANRGRASNYLAAAAGRRA